MELALLAAVLLPSAVEYCPLAWLPLVSTLTGSWAAAILPVNCVAFRLVRPVPLPPKVPFKVTPLAPLVTTPVGSWVAASVPAMLAAGMLPLTWLAFTVPETVMALAAAMAYGAGVMF